MSAETKKGLWERLIGFDKRLHIVIGALAVGALLLAPETAPILEPVALIALGHIALTSKLENRATASRKKQGKSEYDKIKVHYDSKKLD